MTKLKKWQLLEAEDISPSKHFLLEKRTYKLPNGKIVDDFYISTIRDSVHVIPVTTDGKIVMIRMYKQGADKIITQFPAGRMDDRDKDPADVAIRELEEEAGIKVDKSQLIFIGKNAIANTKATEHVHLYYVEDVSFNSKQNLDENEEIEVITVTPQEVDDLILKNEINCCPAIANWYLFKKKYNGFTNLASY